MKKILLLFLIVLFGATNTFAQLPPYFVTGGTGGNAIPLNPSSANFEKCQLLYTPGIFTGAYFGLIDTVWLQVSSASTSGFGAYINFEVSLGQNVGTATTLSATYATGLTSCLLSPSYTTPPTATNNWLPIPLATPFLYNPAVSLIIEIKSQGTGSGVSIQNGSGYAGYRAYGPYASTTGTAAVAGYNTGISLLSNLSCANPTSSAISTITQTTATFNWTDTNNPAGGWDVEYGAMGFIPGAIPSNGIRINTPSKPYTITGLFQNSTYDVYVRARCGSNDTSYFSPKVTFTTLAQCPFPSNLTATNITNSSADLNWTENGVATNWGIEIGLQGFTPSGVPTVTTTTKPYTFSGLPSLFTFDYYVRSICGPGDTSMLIGPYTFTVCSPLSGTYTIDSTLAQGGTNFQSFAQANAIMQSCGIGGPVVFSVLNAVNNEQITLTPITGMSATNTVTFNGHGTATLSTSRTAAPYHTLLLNGADYFVFDSLKFVTDGTVGYAVQLFNGANDNKFKNCTFQTAPNLTTSLSACFVSSGSLTSATTAGTVPTRNTLIENCKALNGYYGITFNGNVSNLDSNNRILNTDIHDFHFYGTFLQNQNGLLANKNNVSRPTRTALTTFYGLYYTATMINSVFDGNHIHNPFTTNATVTSTCYPIYVLGDATSAATANQISNNLIEDINCNGIIYGIYPSSADYLKIYNNTISLDNLASTGTSAVRAIYQLGTGASVNTGLGLIIKNNMISVNQGGSGAKYGIYIASTTAAQINSSHNNVFSTATNFNYGYVASANRLNLAAWQAVASPSVGVGCKALNPIYVNAALNDYKPANALLDNSGTAVGVPLDFLGITRSATTPDIGAFEFTVACPAPTLINASSVMSTSLNLSWTENGSATIWDIEQVPSGTTPTGIATFANVTTNINYPISGLTQYQPVDFYVRAVCGGSNGNSAWNGPFTVLPCAPLAGPYTINATLPASATNFTSFNAVAIALGCGISAPVVFDVDSATYNEQVIFGQVTGSSPTNTITFNGNGATISFATTVSAYHVIQLDGSDYFRFNKLKVASTSTTNAASMQLLNIGNGTRSNMFKNCTFSVPITATSSLVNPFVMSGSATSPTTASTVVADSNIVDSCTIIGGYYAMSFYGGTTPALYGAGNQVTNCTMQDIYYYPVYMLYQNDFLFSNNDISRATRTTLTTFGGVYASGLGERNIFEKNKIHDVFNTAPTGTSSFYAFNFFIDATSAANANIIRNNLVYNITGNGIHYNIYSSTADNLKTYHNTVISDYAAGTAGTIYGVYQAGTAAVGQDIRNNNVFINRTAATKFGYYVATTSTPICNYNNVFLAGGGTNNYGYNNGAIRATLANFQAYGLGLNSTTQDPLFITPPPNYTPSNPALNSVGIGVGVTTDILGNPRAVASPDMGAFEWAASGLDMGVTTITSPNPTVGCYTANDTVKLRIVNFGSNTIDFTTNPLTLTANVSGTTTATATASITTGTLAPLGVLFVPLSPTINMVATGSYTINAYISTIGDTIATNDTLSPTVYNVNLSAGTATANPNVHCASGVSTINLSGNMGGTIQWQQSTSATGPWTNVGTGGSSYTTATLTNTAYFRAYATCNTNADTSSIDTVIVNNPTLLGTTGDTICGPNSALLSAIHNPATSTGINWYSAPTGGVKLDTGAVFRTPVISVTDTFYAEAVIGGGSVDSFGVPIGQAVTCCINFHMTAINVLTNMDITGINLVSTLAANTVNAFDIYYRMGNYTTIPGANTSSAGWISLGTLNGVSQGTTGWMSIDFPVPIPALQGQSVSFHIAPSATPVAPAVVGAYQYSTGFTALSTIFSGPDLEIISGHRGSLFSCTSTGGSPKYQVKYSTGCPAPSRTPVIATVNASSGDLALATSSNTSSTPGLDSLNDMQPDGSTINYFNPSCNLIAKIVDAPGGNVLGQVTSKVNVDPTVSVWNGQPYARRWYDITAQNNGPATVTLYYTQADFNDYNAHPSVISNLYDSLPTSPASPTTNIRITKISGGGLGIGTVTGVITPTTVWNATAMRWEMTFPVTAFSQFFLHAGNPGNAALSVSLSDFTVVKNGSVSDASWLTLMEENNSHFNVQRSLNGRDFVTLGKVNSKGANGTSTAKLAYDFTDYEPQIGHNYYRLEQVDLDGKKSYSGIVDLVWGADGSVVSIYPNPAPDKLNVDVAIDKVTQMEVRLLDMSGRVVKSAVRRTVKGMNNVTLDLSDVAAGLYGVQVYDNNALIHTAKVNKQMK